MQHPNSRPSFVFVLAGLVCLLIIAGLASCTGDSAMSVYLEANRAQLDQPVSDDARPVKFVIAPGTPAKSIAQDLKAAGLINDALLFEAYVRVGGLAAELEAGEYTLSKSMTIPQIAGVLQHALAPSITVVARPGWRLEQTAAYLNQVGALDGDAYRRAALAADLSTLAAEDRQRYSFLQFLPAGRSLEGYLFPDTYQIPRDQASAADLIKRQLDEFEAQAMPLYWDAIAKGDTTLDLHQVVTIASIVEREAVLDEERPVIAGVYLNRLAQNMRLEADPTVQYAMGYQQDTGKWWKTPVYLDEYSSVDSPYNTYLNAGLPPGPIAAPRLSSIKAVLHPAEHDYLYFVAEPNGTGRHVFSRTFEEHLKAVQRYQNQ